MENFGNATPCGDAHLSPRSPTIALLTNDITDSRTHGVWSGIIDTVENYGGHVICYPAGRMDSPDHMPGNQRTILCDLINPGHIDGIITFQWWHDRHWFEQVYQAFHSLPVVTVMRQYSGYPGVFLDSYQDIRQQLFHLIEVHGYRRIVFVRGPEGHPTAETRYRAYRETLAEYQLPFDPKYVIIAAPYTKSFLQESPGEQAVYELLEERRLKPGSDVDAIVAFNDEVAFGILDSLQKRGICIPSEVAVVGFDNRAEANFTCPPLTTMAIPWCELGQKAAEMLFARLAGQNISEQEVLSARLIIRHSCGCFDPVIQYAGGDLDSEEHKTSQKTVAGQRAQILSDLKRAIREEILKRCEKSTLTGWEERLLETFIADASTGTPHALASAIFLRTFEEGLLELQNIGQTDKIDRASRIEEIGQNLLSKIRKFLPSLFPNDPLKISFGETLLHQGRVLASQIARQTRMRQQTEADRQLAMVHEIGQRLFQTFDVASSMNMLAQDLPLLDIPGCYLALYENPQPYHYPQPIPEWSRLLLAYNRHGQIKLPSEGLRFLSHHLLPDSLVSKFDNLVIEPLYSWEEQIGFVVFEMGSCYGQIYELLRSEFSYMLKATLFLQERRQAEKTLRKSLDTLQLAQNQLIQNEKMAALGGLVAGFAHEINTPLGIGVTAASYLEQETQKVKTQYEQGTMTRSFFEKYLHTITQSTSMVLTNLQRAAEYIRSFKQISIDQVTEERRRFHLKTTIDDVLASLQPELKKTRATILIRCPDAIELISYPGAFAQIITNFILNSLLHGFEPDTQGEIHLDAVQHDTTLSFTYRDTGKGIPQDHLPHVFEPFYTTKRGQGGSGLGLYIVYNLVTQRLQGTITCKSTAGEGTLFEVQVPLTVK